MGEATCVRCGDATAPAYDRLPDGRWICACCHTGCPTCAPGVAACGGGEAASENKILGAPWRYEGGAVVSRTGVVIAILNQTRSHPEANGAVLASAPDLYEALRWAEAEIDMRCDPRIPSVKQALTAARAALARARGETP
jgi:hypothetical protein